VRRSIIAVAALATLWPGLGACGSGESSAGGSEDGGLGEVTVFAASSLTASFTELGTMLEGEHPDTKVTFNFASSSDLAVQITEGAPADIFAPADTVQMDVVAGEDLADDPVEFATNRVIVLTPADNPAGIESVEDLARPGIKVVLAAPEVPAGDYARESLDRLGLLQAVEANVVSNEEDVKSVVTKVALGEADAGIAYVTDVTEDVEEDLRAFEFPDEARVVATYPITVLSAAPNPAGAQAFFDLVTSEEGASVLERHGFGAPQ
jgi:molybdate transport system substrate-binding protein